MRNELGYKSKSVFVAVIVLVLFSSCGVAAEDYEDLRKNMVNSQIISRGVKDEKVINAMLKVKRHLFVPKEYEKYAYRDQPLPIGYSQTISQPYIVAFMTEAAGLKLSDKVLEVGTGSGYQAAVLAEIVDKVYTIEILGPLAKSAKQRLKNLGYKNIYVLCGDGYKGWPEEDPFDVIIVTAAPTEIPEELVKQLKEGGRMIIPVGSFSQELYRVTKKDGKIEKKSLLPVRFVPMVHGEE
ncbi:MAG: protein-L-isoaspartate(D-aspartate) O-methyltransferase [Candidatus Aureabacteria bacterium]|nr:protein-L-isoaspartate(D-aspartate) O-methyltransferase [Candidatus Auribacterota bacterium]